MFPQYPLDNGEGSGEDAPDRNLFADLRNSLGGLNRASLSSTWQELVKEMGKKFAGPPGARGAPNGVAPQAH